MNTSRTVVVKALKSFNNLAVGQVVEMQMSRAVAHLIMSHYLDLMEDPAWHAPAFTEPPSE